METVLDGLTAAQAEAVTSDGAPLVILAGAGSGKTRVLTRRIAHRIATGSADAGHVLALTFTRAAAAELRSRLAALGVRQGVAAGTFHAIAYAQLRRQWSATGVSAPSIVKSKLGFVRELVGHLGPGTTGVDMLDLVGEIEWAKARLVAPDDYEAATAAVARTTPLHPAAMAGVYRRYEQEKRRRGVIDLDDLLIQCSELLQVNAEFAASQRWRFRHLFVDEFQDLNPAQAALLAGWRGDGTDLCVVGDPNQAIYSWNGADASHLVDFARREPGATVVALEDNFRSSPQILTVAGAVLLGGGTTPRYIAACDDGPVPTVRAYATDRDEAHGVALGVRAAHRPGSAWSRIAVLARTNAQTALLEEALRGAGIPYRVRGGGSFLRRREVRTELDRMARARGGLRAGVVDLAMSLRELTPEGVEPDGLDDAPVAPSVAERTGVLDELLRLGEEYLALDPSGTVDQFTEWLGTTVGGDASATSDAVEVVTFHAAKGLEWPIVFVVGLEHGLVPIGRAKTPEQEAEERRLLYVAVTRAERELHCSWARERTFGTRTLPRRPSPWLADIEAARAAIGAGGTMAEQLDRVQAERRRLRAVNGNGTVVVGADADPAVLAALKQWRTDAARAAGVPAYVIFHDTTLAAVAEARPDSRDGLLALPGLGPVKAERYGDDLLRVVAEHLAS